MGAQGRATLTLTRKTIRKAVEKNCPLMIVYGIATLGFAWASYWTRDGLSVVLSFFAALVTLLLGLYMLREVITITIERLPEGGTPIASEPPSGDPEKCPCLPPGICKLLRKTLSAIVMWVH